MDKRFPSSDRLLNRAFTLIELMVVMAVIGILAMISLYGYRNFDTQQSVQTAQKDFINNFRSVQNKVNSGNGGNVAQIVLNSNGYSISGVNYSLPSGVAISGQYFRNGRFPVDPSTITVDNMYICVANPNLSSFDSTNRCSIYVGNNFFAYIDSMTVPSPIVVVFAKDNYIKKVQIEGSGMRITRIYEP